MTYVVLVVKREHQLGHGFLISVCRRTRNLGLISGRDTTNSAQRNRWCKELGLLLSPSAVG